MDRNHLVPSHVQAALRILGDHAPDLAARIAAHAIFKPTGRAERQGPRLASTFARATPIDVALGRVRLRAWSWGRGPTVLLAHGWRGSAGDFHAFVAPLVAAGIRVVAFDAPGHGRSRARRSSVVAMAAAVDAVARRLGPLHAVVAHGLGASAVALAMNRGVDARRIALLAPTDDLSLWPERTMSLRGEAATLARHRAELQLGLAYEDLTMCALGRPLRVPALVVHDQDDAIAPFEGGLAAVRAFRDAGLLATAGLGHRGLLEARSVVDEIVSFVVSGLEPRADDAEQRELDTDLFDRDARFVRPDVERISA